MDTQWQAITELERNIQTLEEWAKNCVEGTSEELRSILDHKIFILHRRLLLIRHQVAYCPNCKENKVITQDSHECKLWGCEFDLG